MKLVITLILFFISSICSAEDIEYKLLKNPFIKPSFVKLEDVEQKIKSDSNIPFSGKSLRATLSDGPDSIANVNGQMIFIGDKVNGYKLESVDVGSATFVRNGKKITLNVSEMHKKLK